MKIINFQKIILMSYGVNSSFEIQYKIKKYSNDFFTFIPFVDTYIIKILSRFNKTNTSLSNMVNYMKSNLDISQFILNEKILEKYEHENLKELFVDNNFYLNLDLLIKTKKNTKFFSFDELIDLFYSALFYALNISKKIDKLLLGLHNLNVHYGLDDIYVNIKPKCIFITTNSFESDLNNFSFYHDRSNLNLEDKFKYSIRLCDIFEKHSLSDNEGKSICYLLNCNHANINENINQIYNFTGIEFNQKIFKNNKNVTIIHNNDYLPKYLVDYCKKKLNLCNNRSLINKLKFIQVYIKLIVRFKFFEKNSEILRILNESFKL